MNKENEFDIYIASIYKCDFSPLFIQKLYEWGNEGNRVGIRFDDESIMIGKLRNHWNEFIDYPGIQDVLDNLSSSLNLCTKIVVVKKNNTYFEYSTGLQVPVVSNDYNDVIPIVYPFVVVEGDKLDLNDWSDLEYITSYKNNIQKEKIGDSDIKELIQLCNPTSEMYKEKYGNFLEERAKDYAQKREDIYQNIKKINRK